jgi:hypothetical protein
MPRIECFWAAPIALGRRELRRYRMTSKGECEKRGYCNAVVVLGDVVMKAPAKGDYDHAPKPAAYPPDDPRWPATCQKCGIVFDGADEWQVNDNRYYARSPGPGAPPDDSAERWVLRELPAGAMYDAWWNGWCGKDGIALAVVIPDRDGSMPWHPDGLAHNAPGKLPGWERSGVPPKVTASPSIQSEHYHGMLTDGFLVD